MQVRWRWFSVPALSTLVACTSIIGFNDLQKVEDTAGKDSGTGTTTPPVTTPNPDASTTVVPPPSTTCKSATPWGAPVALTGVLNTTDSERSPTLTSDELTIFFERSSNQGAVGNIFTATRAIVTAPFGTATLVPGLTVGDAFAPSLSPDGLTLLFSAFVTGSPNNSFDLLATTRTATTAAFTGIRALDGINRNGDDDDNPFFSATNELFFTSSVGSSVNQIWRSTVSGTTFGAPALVGELAGNVAGYVRSVSVSRDGLNLYFSSDKSGGQGQDDVWMTSRASLTSPFGPPAVVTPLNSASEDQPGWISIDNCRMYLGSTRTGAGDLYVATRSP